MTEAYEDDWLVRVRAQVMCRDEGTGGWVPLGGGGLSNVMVRKRPTHSLGTLESLLCETSRPARPHHRHTPSSASQQLTTTTAKGHHYKQLGGSGGQLEMAGQRGCALDSSSDTVTDRGAPLKFEYFIYGKRISDQSVVLSCTIKKDFQYNKVMPTFHHWLTDEKRFGLTFQTAADARAFDRGVRTAIEDLLDGLGGAWPSLHAYKKHNPAPKDDEDDNIFECLNLPSDSRSSSENSTASRPSHQRHQQQGGQAPQPRRPGTQQSTPGAAVFHLDVRQPNLYTDTMSLSASARELLLKKKLAGSCSEEPPMFVGDPLNADNYSYVQLTQVHEYVYPSLGSGVVTVSSDRSPSQSALQRRDSGSSLKKRAQGSLYTEAYRPTLAGAKRERDMAKKPLPIMEGFHARLKCRHCQEWYMESSNKPGSCEYAPDCFKSCINAATCIRCAQCMQYHCMSDAEGEFATHPCSCNSNEEGCSRRWLSLALLSILVPCLWCYPPLKAVHWCCVGCGVSGGRHTPVQRSLHAYPHH